MYYLKEFTWREWLGDYQQQLQPFPSSFSLLGFALCLVCVIPSDFFLSVKYRVVGTLWNLLSAPQETFLHILETKLDLCSFGVALIVPGIVCMLQIFNYQFLYRHTKRASQNWFLMMFNQYLTQVPITLFSNHLPEQ